MAQRGDFLPPPPPPPQLPAPPPTRPACFPVFLRPSLAGTAPAPGPLLTARGQRQHSFPGSTHSHGPCFNPPTLPCIVCVCVCVYSRALQVRAAGPQRQLHKLMVVGEIGCDAATLLVPQPEIPPGVLHGPLGGRRLHSVSRWTRVIKSRPHAARVGCASGKSGSVLGTVLRNSSPLCEFLLHSCA